MKNDELWEPCPGWEELYEVSSSGRVRDSKTKEIKKQYPNNNGKYLAVTLTGYGRSVPTRVHRLVAKAFIDNPSDKPLVLHRNDNGLDNCVDNLYWGTKSDNTYDAIRNGKHPSIIVTGKQIGRAHV